MVMLLLARASFVHGHAVLSADILLNCLLCLWCLQRGIHSSGSNLSAFHGATSFSDTKRDLKHHLKKKTVPGVLWINITPPFCVYKSPLAPLILNRIIPQTSCTGSPLPRGLRPKARGENQNWRCDCRMTTAVIPCTSVSKELTNELKTLAGDIQS